jgi:Fe-S cluster assembly ATP-binding protein
MVDNMLQIRDLCVSVEGQELLYDVNLAVPRGEVHALLGPNGGGKTTLLMTIMGYPRYVITSGTIVFDDQDVTALGLTERARAGIGIVHQRPPTVAGVQLQQLLARTSAGDSPNNQQIQRWSQDPRLTHFLLRDVNAGLSGGEIKRSELLQMMVLRPKFAMMDEPESGVDIESMQLISEMANELYAPDPSRPARRSSGLIITHTGHILDYVHVDKAHIIIDGHMACHGNPDLILEKICVCGYTECARCIAQEV